MDDDILKISKKSGTRGDDGYKTFSIRIKHEIVAELDNLSTKTNRSRNELINIILEFGVGRCEIEE
jgi:predicted DNA-binding protein